MNVPLSIIAIGVGVLLLASTLASKASTKLGVPALVLFVLLGMLSGSEGLGGIEFDDFHLTRDLGWIGLAFILFAGGLETKWRHVRPVLGNALSLSTIGVLITAVLIGGSAVLIFDLPPIIGLLLGAIVSSTDAAAVFGVLSGRGVHLKKGVGPLLELESGTNDPMAVFLTTAITGLIINPDRPYWSLVPLLFVQMMVGGIVGYVAGRGAAWMINRTRLTAAGLYPAITIAAALISFGGAEAIYGNAFLSVYVCGMTLGNRNFLHKQSLIHFHDGVAWLMQILTFLMLGLLVYPSQLLPLALPSLALALMLVFVARPVAVFVSLALSRRKLNEKLFISWTGLRGAFPIILATIPLTSGGTPEQQGAFHIIFNAVFFTVLVSVLLQGTFVEPVARFLKVTAPGSVSTPHRHRNTIELKLEANSPCVGMQLVDLALPRWALLLLVTRDGESFVPQGSTTLQEGDVVLLVTRKEDLKDLAQYLLGLDPMIIGAADPEEA